MKTARDLLIILRLSIDARIMHVRIVRVVTAKPFPANVSLHNLVNL
ncbi:MAG TPA: hypothetical protein VHP38_06395 [Ruminiclostridium sp.]|nr:hypothetical protein [Ruminiclostridium sp.]